MDNLVLSFIARSGRRKKQPVPVAISRLFEH
jgi:hypothetical protein